MQAQINSLNNIIREKPAAILIDAASAEALNPTIAKACAAGIVVVTFDQTVTADCAYKLHSDFDIMANNQAEWMAAMLGGKGKVLMDDGLAGAPISEQFAKNFAKAFAKYPGIEVVGHYNGNYALGPEQQGVAALLAAHPQVDGILTQAYGTGAMQALTDADRTQVPIVAAAFNGTGVACAQTEGAHCWLGANPPSLSAEAIKLAVDILDGKAPRRQDRALQLAGPDHRPDRGAGLRPELDGGEDRARQDRVPGPRARAVAADLARLGDDHAAGGVRELTGGPRRQAH